ncbi:MAG: glycosyltransferase [Flavobacterium sp.]|uniref:glycosyltransferase n=1 Tax=Flavobacterium sp. TaxID=239 RepID=UPI003263587F
MEALSKIKIIRLTTFLDFGGIEKRLINISTHQDQNKWLFCALNHGGNAEAVIQNNGKRVICFNYSYRIPSIITLYKLVRFFKKEKPDVVHTSGSEANFHGILAAKLAGVPIIIGEEVGIPNQSKTARIIFSKIYLLTDYIVGNSIEVIEYLRNHNNVSAKKLKQIPNPVIFPELPKSIKTEDGFFNLISVSRLEKVKNIDSILRVVARLIELNLPVHYTILGDGSKMNHLKKMTKELNIESAVTFLGFQDNPYPYLLKADLYLLTSFTEGFSNSLAEAMYCGIPSLTTRVGAAQEMIEDDKNGWIVNVNDDDDLFNKINYIIKIGNHKRMEIAEKGKETVVKNFSLQNHVNLLMTMYKKNKE